MDQYPYMFSCEKTHASVYKSFYAKYDLVISLPHLFRFGHAIGRGNSVLTMRHKLPHQLLLGINVRPGTGCHFQEVVSYDFEKLAFREAPAYEYIRNVEDIASACTTLMHQLVLVYRLDVGVLTEYPKGYGISFNTVIYTLLAVALFLLEKKLPIENLKNYSFQHTHLFADIAMMACYLKYLAHGSAGSCLPFIALQSVSTPLLQMGTVDFSTFSPVELQQRLWQLSRLLEVTTQHPDTEDLGLPAKRAFGRCSLHDMGVSGDPQLPVDIAILHLGASFESLREKESLLVRLSSGQRLDWFNRLAEQQGIDITLDESLLPVGDVYGHMSTMLYTRLFHALVHALADKDHDAYVTEMIAVIKDMGFYHCLTERHYDMIALLTTVWNLKKQFPEERVAFLPITTVKTGGTFLVVFPRHRARKTFEEVCGTLAQDYSTPNTVLYASRKEPHGGQGVQLKQYLSAGHYSSYITTGTVQLVTGHGAYKIGPYDDLLTDELLNSGITFDLIKKKILVNGKKITHKSICSQSATIEIIMHLLANIGDFVPNRFLPSSGYSKNKNEMISKILLPFQGVLKQIGEEPLDIVCEGTLYEWTICLKQSHKNLHILRHMMQ